MIFAALSFRAPAHGGQDTAPDWSQRRLSMGAHSGGGYALPEWTGGSLARRPVPTSGASTDSPPAGAVRPEPVGNRRWLLRPVSFDVERYPLARLLREFATAQGVASQVSERLVGTVSGIFNFPDPGELLDVLCRVQHMNWYYDGSTVYFFSNSEMDSRLFPLEGRREEQLRSVLDDLGLYDPRFGWRVADGGRLLLVQGPSVYLERVAAVLERQVEAAAAELPEKKLGVFRLKHAWAAERSVVSGDASTRVPGVADLLRQILAEQAAEAGAGSQPGEQATPTPPGTPRMKMGTGVLGRERAAPQATAAAPSSAIPFIQADTRLNAVLVWDFEENLPRHRAIIETLDQPLALVEIRAAIIDVEADRTRDLGISWGYDHAGGRWQTGIGGNRGKDVDFESATGDGLQYATIYTHGLDKFMLRVSALEKDGTANILSRPSVLTQDNIQASIEHTETFYVRLEGKDEVDLADITTGLTLRVTPHVIQGEDCPEGVQLAVYIVNGTDAYDTSSQVDSLPRVRQSTISTQAVVQEGEALIIGGYYNETRSLSNSGVPVLGKVPVLGALFRTRGKQNVKSERLFVLSPRIVYPGESPMVSGTEAERTMRYSPATDLMGGPPFDDPAAVLKNARTERGWIKDMVGK